MLPQERGESLTCVAHGLTESPSHESDNGLSKSTLFEDYNSGKLALHAHLSIFNGKRSKLFLEMRRARKIFGPNVEFPVSFEGDSVAWSRASCQSGHVNIPVLVIVCEGSKVSQSGLHRVSPTVVRLQTFDNCDHIERNPIKSIGTNLLIKGTVAIDDGKLMRWLGGLAWVVSPEEFAHEIIKTRIGGLNDISKNVRDDHERIGRPVEVSPSLSLSVVISVNEELCAFRIGVSRNCLIEDLEMMMCPL